MTGFVWLNLFALFDKEHSSEDNRTLELVVFAFRLHLELLLNNQLFINKGLIWIFRGKCHTFECFCGVLDEGELS